jgi:hypothetical protein
MPVYSHYFDSVEQLVAACTQSIQAKGVHNATVGGVTRSSFIGRPFGGWDEVIKAANSPWDEGIQTVQGMLDELRGEADKLPRPTDRRRRRAFSEDHGDEVDYDRLRTGQPYWSLTQRQRCEGPQRVALVTDVTTSAFVSAHKILWRGVASLVLADLLEQAGYRVGLWSAHHCNPSYNDGHGSFFGTLLKDYQQPLDVAALVNAVSGWFYRTVQFQAYYTRPESYPYSSLGHPRPVLEDMPEVIDMVGTGSCPVVVRDIWSKNEAINKVRLVIERVNSGQEVLA